MREFRAGKLLKPFANLWLLLLALAGLGIMLKYWQFWPSLLALYLLSTPWMANLLMQKLEHFPPLVLEQFTPQPQDVIVILGGGAPRKAPEMGGLRPSTYTLERLRYSAWLHKKTELPILVSGGGYHPEAPLMKSVLAEDYGVPVKWVEDRSRTTWENAELSRALLNDRKTRYIVVTQAWHMPRAVFSFERLGLDIVPAPTAHSSRNPTKFRLGLWIPDTQSLAISERVMREYIGYGVYWFRDWWERMMALGKKSQ